MAGRGRPRKDANKAPETRYQAVVTSISEELDHMIRLVRQGRERMEASDEASLGQLNNLSKVLTNIVTSKVKFDETLREAADSATEEDRIQAVIDYLAGLTDEQRKRVADTL